MMHGVSGMQCVSQFDPDIFTLSHSLTAHSKYSNVSTWECNYLATPLILADLQHAKTNSTYAQTQITQFLRIL